MVQVLTPEGLHFPTHKEMQKNVIPLDKLKTRKVQSQEVIPTSLLLAQSDYKSGNASVLLARCSSSRLFLCLSVSLISNILWLHSLYVRCDSPSLFECFTCLSLTSVSLHHSL